MTVTYHSGNRLQATSTDFNNGNGIPAVTGGWVELGRTTLGSANQTITVSGLANKRYLMVLCNTLSTVNTNPTLRLNSNSGSNYTFRQSNNGGADGTSTSNDNMPWSQGTSRDTFDIAYIANYTSKEKLAILHSVNQSAIGAGTAPERMETVGKYVDTSNPISAVSVFSHSSNNFSAGSELVVLGWDPIDTHTTNFWQELASVELGSAGDTLSSGTFTAKKYLWVQYYFNATGGNADDSIRFNGDSGGNYSRRGSYNNGSEFILTGYSEFQPSSGAITAPDSSFTNMFIINNTSNEKLCLSHTINKAGSGAGTAPNRSETVAKWVNTSSQITSITVNNLSAGSYNTGAILKVYGSD